MTNLFTTEDVLGWIGTAGLIIFYVLLAKRKILWAYAAGTTASILWLFVGLLTAIPSLVVLEVVIICINVYGMYNWFKEEKGTPIGEVSIGVTKVV